MSNKCVIIGDIKKSSRLNNWPGIFKELKKSLSEINKRYSNDIVVTFKPTVGDEFQGAIIKPEKVFEIYSIIKSKLPVNVYYGIGIGDIEKPFTDEIGMRGSAFYRARDALEICKKKKRSIFIKSSDTPNQTDDLINMLLRFIEVFEYSFTKRQREIVNYYRLHPNYTYDQLAEHFNTSKQSISQILKAANWELISEGGNFAKEFLKNMYSNTDGVKEKCFTNESKGKMLYKWK